MELKAIAGQNRSGPVKRLLGLGAFHAVLTLLALWIIYPHRPADAIGWVLLLILGAPSVLGLELVGKSFGKVVDRRKTSVGRVVFAVALIVAVVAICVFVWIVLKDGRAIQGVGEFFSEHFVRW